MIKRLKNYILRNLIKTPVIDDIISYGKNGFVYKGEPINETQLKNLVAEAKFMKECVLWKIMTNDLRKEAIEIMVNRSVKFDDVITGKAILSAIDLQNKLIERLVEKS